MESNIKTDTSFFNGNDELVFAGWNRSKTNVPNVNIGIHHPSGDIQKVCREDDGAFRTDGFFIFYRYKSILKNLIQKNGSLFMEEMITLS